MKMTVDEAVEKITALRELTAQTGTQTTRTQNDILRSLDDADLVEVAVRLKRASAVVVALGGAK
jgi:hypothetical protein